MAARPDLMELAKQIIKEVQDELKSTQVDTGTPRKVLEERFGKMIQPMLELL